MLPIKAGDLHVVDRDGVKYGLRYLIGGQMQREYTDMINASAKALRSLGRMQNLLKEAGEDSEKAEGLYDQLNAINDQFFEQQKKLVSMFLASVNGESVNDPCEVFRHGHLVGLAELIQENLPILSGNEVREIKNSSRPLSSASTQTVDSTDAKDATGPQNCGGDADGR